MGPGPAGRRGPRGSSASLSSAPTRSCLAGGPTRSSPAPGRSRSANALQQQAFRADSLPAGSAARVDPWGIRASTASVPQAEPVAGPGGGRALRLCPRRPVRPIWSDIPDGSLIRTRVNRGPPAVEHSRTCPPRYRQRTAKARLGRCSRQVARLGRSAPVAGVAHQLTDTCCRSPDGAHRSSRESVMTFLTGSSAPTARGCAAGGAGAPSSRTHSDRPGRPPSRRHGRPGGTSFRGRWLPHGRQHSRTPRAPPNPCS
jgi:hypothetical protein